MQRNADEQRRQENAAVLRHMRNNGNLCHTDLGAYRWAPRQVIKKDQKEMDRVYGIERRPTIGIVTED